MLDEAKLQNMGKLALSLEVIIPFRSYTVAEVAGFTPGQVLKSSTAVGERYRIRVDGAPIGRGDVLQQSGKRVICVQQLDGPGGKG